MVHGKQQGDSEGQNYKYKENMITSDRKNRMDKRTTEGGNLTSASEITLMSKRGHAAVYFPQYHKARNCRLRLQNRHAI